MRMRTGLMVLSALALLPAAPALAHGKHPRSMTSHLPMGPTGVWGGSYMPWSGAWQPPYEGQMPVQADGQPQYQPRDREEWLRECRRRLGDNGVGGAVIGGVLGGVAGNVIAGRGNRVLGTVAGAAAGAVAGAVIDKAEDAPRNRDRCEAMLEAGPGYGQGYAPGYAGYGYAVPMMMVPVMMVPMQQGMAAKPDCKTVVTTTTEYVDAPRRRYIPRRAVPDKRVRMVVPDKRVQY